MVEAVPLDEFPLPPGRFAIKIDTQGAEPLIFEAGRGMLFGAGPIIAEFWPWAMQHFAYGQVLRHGEAAGMALPIPMVIARLEAPVIAGGEHKAADPVLIRSITNNQYSLRAASRAGVERHSTAN